MHAFLLTCSCSGPRRYLYSFLSLNFSMCVYFEDCFLHNLQGPQGPEWHFFNCWVIYIRRIRAEERTINSLSKCFVSQIIVLLVFVVLVISDIEDMRHTLFYFFIVLYTITYICAKFGFAWLWYLEMAPLNVAHSPNTAPVSLSVTFSRLTLDYRCISAGNCPYSPVKCIPRQGCALDVVKWFPWRDLGDVLHFISIQRSVYSPYSKYE